MRGIKYFTGPIIFEFFVRLYLFLLPWQTVWIIQSASLNGVNWTYGTIVYYLTEFLLWGVIGVFFWWYIGEWRKKKREGTFIFQLSTDRLFLLSLMSVVLYSYLTILWASDQALAWQHARWIMQAVLFFLVLLLAPVDRSRFMHWFVVGGVIQAIVALIQFFTQSTVGFVPLGLVEHPVWMPGTSIVGSEEIGRWLRPYAAFSHPNVLGGYVSITLFACAKLLLKQKGNVQRSAYLFYFVFFLLLLAGVFVTFSRSAWLSGGVVLLWSLWQFRNMPRAWVWQGAPLIIVGVFTLLYLPLVTTRMVPASLPEVRSVTERISYIDQAVELWRQSPLFGVGVGNYTAVLYQQYPQWRGWMYQPVHIVPLLFVVELGIVGSLLGVCALCIGVRYWRKYGRISSDVFVGTILFVILMLFDHYLYSSYVGLMMAVVLLFFLGQNKIYFHMDSLDTCVQGKRQKI